MKRILVINPFGIGDVIFSLYLVEALRRSLPDAFIGFLCNERTDTLVRMDTSINKTFVMNRDALRAILKKNPILYWREWKGMWDLIRDLHFDTVFDLSLGREFSFFSMMIGIKKRIGFDYKGRGLFLTQKRKLKGYAEKPVADIQLELLNDGCVDKPLALPLSLAVSDTAKSEAKAFLKKDGVPDDRPILALAPGGGKSWGQNARYKQWDAEYFAQVSNTLNKTHPHRVCLMGDRSEEGLLRQVQSLLDTRTVMVAGESIPLVSALLQNAWLLLCNDGGLLHLADALGVKTVSIFGPVDEKVYGPYHRDKPHAVVTNDVPCRPCYKQFHFPPCPYERRCLSQLSVEKVLRAIKELA